MPQLTDDAAAALAEAYLSDPQRHTSQDVVRADRLVRQTATILATISRYVSTSSQEEAKAEFPFVLDPSGEPNGPAGMNKKDGELFYYARIALASVERLFDLIVSVHEVPARNYDPMAFVVAAVVTALAHEYSHGLYGHKEKVETNISGSRFLEELDADRRGGVGSLCLFVDRELRRMMGDFFNLKDPMDFLEAAMVGHSLLAFWLAGGREDLYAGPTMRCFMYYDGLRSIALRERFADLSQINLARTNADRIVVKIAKFVEGGDRLIKIREDHLAAETEYKKTFKKNLYKRTDETVAASPFWIAFSGRSQATWDDDNERHGIVIRQPTLRELRAGGVKVPFKASLLETICRLVCRWR
ncbi:hypothetical protein [Rhizobium lentis]|uniref:hypothetical protein n=1 Tax=Rhizobium lentis TaxID=1138194 RepID=UPI001C829C4F|nr:hypothetical protein [Rhizobium lentis]MBX5049841.1 hypothetical protein [Rhizobium lentis]MBX5061602.1 hypothetical protein [Rhizobium lentis]